MGLGMILMVVGIAVFGAALIGMIVSNIVLSSKGKKLKKLMHDKYGD